MSSTPTILWHDYETTGVDPARDRPLQFAALRTDEALQPVDEPIMWYCQPPRDRLPSPDAALVTGITPQFAEAKGESEARFMALIHEEFSRPGTCGAGYNSLRFDDQVTRHGLYRNLYDPYAREWRNGNSRWDVIDLMRACHALRPDGIEWPEREGGLPSFRLEDLTTANAIAHGNAHDALADVTATLEMARLVLRKQPRLFNFYYGLRRKKAVQTLIDIPRHTPIIHVSGMYPAERGNISVVVPICEHPSDSNGVLIYDLREPPEPFLSLSADELAHRLFTPRAELGDAPRLPVKTVHINRSPFVAPLNTLDDASARRHGLNHNQLMDHREALLHAMSREGFTQRLRDAQGLGNLPEATDPELMLYSGPFLSNADRARLERVRGALPHEPERDDLHFSDPRLPELVFRYRARNHPHTLSGEEMARWNALRARWLSGEEPGMSMSLADYRERIATLLTEAEATDQRRAVLEALRDWGEALEDSITSGP
ncbi:MAG: exodeoxyribonuclease I [Gammaproteobacteria bacterium]